MSLTDTELFTRLKGAVQAQVAERLGIRKAAKDWSLNDIRDFQADLESVCKSSVSEKWFYTHFKNDSDKLPRVDVLNLLSQYCGFKNWDEFVFQENGEANSEQEATERPKKRSLPRWAMLGFWAIVLPVLTYLFWPQAEKKTLLFTDAYTQEKVEMQKLDIRFTTGPLIGKTASAIVRVQGDTLLVDGAYYKPKKVFLGGDEDTVRITLFPDDYALMLNFFSRSSTDDWQKRHEQLMEAIHPEAKIFQSHPQYEGIELLNREEFIERLILPINSLKNLEIQDVVYKDDKIYRLRFIQKIEEDESN